MVERTFEGVAVRARWLLALLPLLIADTHAQAPRLQAAVLANGFAALHGDHVAVIDRAGGRRDIKLAMDDDARVIGAGGTLGVAWHDGPHVKLGIGLPEEGTDISTWGTRVKMLCDGAASNDQRFGVGWLEADGRVWVVHGATGEALEATAAGDLQITAMAKPSWCGVASAADKIVLLWRDGDRVYMNHCKKSCANVAPKVPIEKKAALVGFGCTKNACLFAQRTATGTSLVLSSENGRAKWKTPLEGTTGERIEITAAGDRALAVAFESTDGGALVRRYDVKTGAASTVWRDRAAHGLPALAWAADKLLVAHRHGDALAPQVVHLPR